MKCSMDTHICCYPDADADETLDHQTFVFRLCSDASRTIGFQPHFSSFPSKSIKNWLKFGLSFSLSYLDAYDSESVGRQARIFRIFRVRVQVHQKGMERTNKAVVVSRIRCVKHKRNVHADLSFPCQWIQQLFQVFSDFLCSRLFCSHSILSYGVLADQLGRGGEMVFWYLDRRWYRNQRDDVAKRRYDACTETWSRTVADHWNSCHHHRTLLKMAGTISILSWSRTASENRS